MDSKLQTDMTQRMTKAVEAMRHEFVKLRTGRPSAAIFDTVRVECYGNQMPVNQVANISIPDNRTVVLTPWDKSVIAELEKAIHKSNLGLTPVNDGKVVRINIPPLNEERRKDLTKVAKKMTEDSRVTIRNIRRDIIEAVKKLHKEKNLPEDDLKKWENEVQKTTDQFIAQIDTLLANKEKEVMEV